MGIWRRALQCDGKHTFHIGVAALLDTGGRSSVHACCSVGACCEGICQPQHCAHGPTQATIHVALPQMSDAYSSCCSEGNLCHCACGLQHELATHICSLNISSLPSSCCQQVSALVPWHSCHDPNILSAWALWWQESCACTASCPDNMGTLCPLSGLSLLPTRYAGSLLDNWGTTTGPFCCFLASP